jgi:hypothetical protein
MAEFGKCTGGGRRDKKREAAPLIAFLTTRSQTYNTVLIDVSASGARVRSDDLPEVGSELVMSVEKVKTFGTVRWHSSTDCGVEFDQPLSQMEVFSLRRAVADGMGIPPEMKAALDDWVLGVAR